MMHGYSDFPKDVTATFAEIIRNYCFQVVKESPTEIILKSQNCIIQLMTEYDYVQFYFKQFENEKWMFLGPFLEVVYPNESIRIPSCPENLTKIEMIRFSLRCELEMIKKYCLPILKGDFSWKQKYRA